MDKYSAKFDEEVSLKTKTVIFLDTNVLLRYYSISFTAREKLFDFLVKNKKRIIVTPQIQIEFIRNREENIQRFFEQVTSKIPQDFKTDIVNKMKNFSEQNEVILKDYPFVESDLKGYKSKLEDLLKKLNEAVDLKKKEHLDLIYKDKLLDFLATCTQYEGLTTNELDLVKQHFDSLKKNLTPESIDSLTNKQNGAFPGLGDIRNKPEDPYGDYTIFHEIMKYMMNEKVDTIFLTFDNTKGDWMNKNRTPHLHYIQNMYSNTGKILYILDAERAFDDLLKINIESLIPSIEQFQSIPITPETLYQFLLKSPIFTNVEIVPCSDFLIKELNISGYLFINEIENDLNRVAYGIKEFRNIEGTTLNSTGVLRVGLRIANREYKHYIGRADGAIHQISKHELENYKKYSELIEH